MQGRTHKLTSTLSAAVALVLVSGCARSVGLDAKPVANITTGTGVSAATPVDNFPRLRTLAESQAREPRRQSTAAAAPQSTAPLAEVIAAFAAQVPETPLAPPQPTLPPALRDADQHSDEGVHRDSKTEATRLYASGRQRLLTGDNTGAKADFQAAVALDPSAIEPRRELADAALALGDRAGAIEAITAAVALGENSARSYEILARDAAERQDADRAAAWYAKAAQSLGLDRPQRPTGDPTLIQIVRVGLADQLRTKGHTAAASELTQAALLAQAPFSSSARYSRQAGELFRRQGDLWRQIGDDFAALGDHDRAIQAYAQARNFPSLDGQPITPRLVAAALASGRTARAALVILDPASADEGETWTLPRLSEQDVSLLGQLTTDPHTGKPLREAIAADLAQRLAPAADIAPSEASALARLQASLDPSPRSAITHLARGLVRNPSDLALARQLIRTALASDRTLDNATTLAIEIITTEPRSAPALAQALLLDGPSTTSVLDAINAAPRSDAATLLAASALAAQGLMDPAVDRLGDSAAPVFAQSRVEFLAAAGRPVPSIPLSDGLAIDSDSAALRRAAARSLTVRQRHRGALEALEPLLVARVPGESIWRHQSDVLTAAELAIALGDATRAMSLLTRAQRLDPGDDRPIALRLTLHNPAGLSPSQASLNAALRELRTSLADSRTAKLLRAREALRRSLFQQAMREAQALADADPSDAAALDTLITAARQQRPNNAGETINWLNARLNQLSSQPTLLAAWATLRIKSSDATGNITRLDEIRTRVSTAVQSGGGVDASRLLEALLRDDMKLPLEAQTVANQRWARYPASIATLLERLQADALGPSPRAAAADLVAVITPDVTLINDQPQRLVALTGQLFQRAAEELRNVRPNVAVPLDPAAAAGLELATILDARAISTGPELAGTRLLFLAIDPRSTPAVLLTASTAAARAHPELRGSADLRIVGGLSAARRIDDSLAYIPLAIDPKRDPRPAADERVELAAEWFRIIAFNNLGSQARPMIDGLHAADPALLSNLVTRLSNPNAPAPESPRAELAFILGNLFHAQGHEAESEAAYILALEYQPDHAWTANNLGYAWADKGVNLDRAADLLELAHAKLPDEAPITDSLGWLRYKENKLEDFTDAKTNQRREGAVTLLVKAANSNHGQEDLTIQDHAGDALWLAGRAEEATRRWELALKLARRTIADVAQRAGNPNQNAELSNSSLDEARRVAMNASAKLAAAAANTRVPVAAQYANPQPQPAKRPDADPAINQPGNQPQPNQGP